MNSAEPLPGVAVNAWNNWEGIAQVYYLQYGLQADTAKQLQQLFTEVRPDVLFVNGLFSPFFNILPLKAGISYCKQNPGCKIVLSARGMLHPGALSQKAFKKKLFILWLRLMGWPQKVYWHATDVQEEQFVHAVFGTKAQVRIAGNFPNLVPALPLPEKQSGIVNLGTIALISPMKNHLLVLKALQTVTAAVNWHIYGPVKDAAYWEECLAETKKLPANIRVHYHGECNPADLNEALQRFQLFIMPSKSENFGHAILEALSAGRPVITTDTTPFKQLQQEGAGYSISLQQPQQLAEAITFFAAMDAEKFAEAGKKATAYAADFANLYVLRRQYQHLFT